MALSDLFIGNGFNPIVYIGFVIMVLCGFLIRNRQTVTNLLVGSISGAVLFYLITNFAFFYPATMYPHNLSGILASYVAGLPFLNNMLVGDLIYGTALFGSFYLLRQRYPVLAR